ncbi:hypothetical protein K8R43_01975 [archaeon]|nr:hypothetical protein [archaeon]
MEDERFEPTRRVYPHKSFESLGIGTRVKYWFSSLFNGTAAAKELKGKVGIGTGFLNIIPALIITDTIILALASIFVILRGEAVVSTIGLIGAAVAITSIIGVVFWLINSFLTHVIATALGGNGNYNEYAGLVSFPRSGACMLGIPCAFIPFLGGIMQLVIGIAILSAEVKITKEEYGISKLKSFVAVITSGIAIVLILIVLAVVLAYSSIIQF